MSALPVLSPEAAMVAVLSGCFLIFFGYYTYRTTIVVYLAVVGAIVGSVLGEQVAHSDRTLVWTLVGALVGALVAVPVEAFMRLLLGAVSGGVLGLAIGAMTGRVSYAMVGAALGAIVGGALWAWVGDIFIMAMFSVLGAIDVLIGIAGLSAHYGRSLDIGPGAVVGLLVAAVLGTAFQYILVHPPKGPVPEREGEVFDEHHE
ncbi:MAG: glycine zipper 2TM domain-containing protein [Planctomycetes bacterium]|nr:glycine zipper 2TM domain-containing protein [Planctomycetota bacterium]